jgi:hypothetical protein
MQKRWCQIKPEPAGFHLTLNEMQYNNAGRTDRMSHRDLADAVPVHQTLDPATAGATITLHETTQRRALEMLQSTEADLGILSDLPKGASHSVKISAVCSPSMGGGKDGVGGISSKRIGLAIKRTSPDAGCFMVCTMPRSLSCGVSQTSLTVLRRHRGWPRHRCGAQHLSPWRPVPAFPRRPAQNLDPHRLMTLKLDLRSHASRNTTLQTRRRSSDAYANCCLPERPPSFEAPAACRLIQTALVPCG